MPTAIASAETFDASTGVYSASTFINGPSEGTIILPSADLWRLSGTAGPDPAEQPPEPVKHATKMLVAYLFENRGDVADEFGRSGYFHRSGIADLLKPYRKVA